MHPKQAPFYNTKFSIRVTLSIYIKSSLYKLSNNVTCPISLITSHDYVKYLRYYNKFSHINIDICK